MKKNYNLFLVLIMFVMDILYIYQALTLKVYDRLLTYIALPFVLLIPQIYEKIFKRDVDINLKVIFYTFIFVADFLGCVVNLYNTTEWFDLFAHYLSGVLSAFVAMIMMKNFHYKETKFGIVIYVLSVTCLIAVSWEIFEFCMDNFAGMNLQHVIETGVHDTMEDVIIAVIGSISFLVAYLSTPKKGKLHTFITDVKI